jgi:Alcohol dehydrogenase GroES-associated
MKALCRNGKNDIRCETVPDPKIEEARDVIIKGLLLRDLRLRSPSDGRIDADNEERRHSRP